MRLEPATIPFSPCATSFERTGIPAALETRTALSEHLTIAPKAAAEIVPPLLVGCICAGLDADQPR